MDENGQRQPCGLFKALGINLVKEKDVIKRRRKLNSSEEIPRDLEFIRHLRYWAYRKGRLFIALIWGHGNGAGLGTTSKWPIQAHL